MQLNTKNNMMIFVITLSDKKFDEKYRNFCYKNLTSLTKQFKGDLEDYLDDMDDYLTDKDEKGTGRAYFTSNKDFFYW